MFNLIFEVGVYESLFLFDIEIISSLDLFQYIHKCIAIHYVVLNTDTNTLQCHRSLEL